MQSITNRQTIFQIGQIFHPAIESIATEDVVVADRLSRQLFISFHKQTAMGSHQCCNFR